MAGQSPFARMDGAMIAATAIAEYKARASAKYRRPATALEQALQKSDMKYILSPSTTPLLSAVAPLIENGNDYSGGTGSQSPA